MTFEADTLDPALASAGWESRQIIREYYFTDGRKLAGVQRGTRCFQHYEKEPDFAIKNVALFKPRVESQCMEYFLYFLLSPDAIGRMKSSSKGAAQRLVGLGVLRGFIIPLPPLNEQKRIVAKLDALFTRIDTTITHLQQTLELSKALFASALKVEVSGEGNNWPSFPLNTLGAFSGGIIGVEFLRLDLSGLGSGPAFGSCECQVTELTFAAIDQIPQPLQQDVLSFEFLLLLPA